MVWINRWTFNEVWWVCWKIEEGNFNCEWWRGTRGKTERRFDTEKKFRGKNGRRDEDKRNEGKRFWNEVKLK